MINSPKTASKQLRVYEVNRRQRSFRYLIFHINEGAHVELLGEGHAVVELDAMHSVVVEIKPLQLERQQVGEVQKSQPLCGDAGTQQSDRKGRQAGSSISRCHDPHGTFAIRLLFEHRISFGNARRSTGWVHPEFLVG